MRRFARKKISKGEIENKKEIEIEYETETEGNAFFLRLRLGSKQRLVCVIR